jgi:glycosyltransferase 2 family protein
MRRAHFVLKLILSATLIGLLFWFVDVEGALAALSALGPRELVAVIALTALAMVTSAWRFHRILRHLGEDIRFAPLLGDTLVMTTYNMLLPTPIGGDIARGLRSADRAKVAPHVWAATAFERLFGLVTLAGMGLGGVFALSRALPAALIVTCLLVVAGIAVLALALPRLLRRASGRLPVLATLAGALEGPLAGRRVRLETAGWSIVYQLVSLSILAVALPEPNTELVLGVYLGVPLALIAGMAPITIAGVGLRESLFVVVLLPFGYSKEQAFALAVVWLGSTLMAALAGALVLLAERRVQVAT